MEIDRNIVEEFKELSKGDIEFSKKCSQIIQEINSGQLTILQLVEQLGGLLVDVSPTNRELGTWILTKVLEGLPPNHFDSKHLSFICTFYTDRLKDHHQVVPAVLGGILALSKFEHFPDGAATQILSTLFQHISCQQQQQKDRYNIYRIFETLLEKHTTELCTMGLDYVYGVISAVDGERDPKNLMLLFNWFPKFVKTVKLGHLAEECFEIFACYFPVDFKAPPQDPNTITRDRLAEALTPCLTAIPEFAEFCFPLALEKLDSSLEVAKLDSLKLLESGCDYFSVASYVQHSTEIWSQIQKELFNNPSPEIESACLSTLTSVIKKISQDTSVIGTVKDISDTVKRNLLPDSKLFEPSWKLLLSVAKASQTSCDLITREIAPILINTFNITLTPAPKMAVLKVLINFFDNYVILHDNVDFEEVDNIPILCLKGVVEENNELRMTGFDGLRQLSRFLSANIRLSVYETLRKLILMPQSEEVRTCMLKCFEELANNYPTEIKEKIVDLIEVDNIQNLALYLDALCTIAPQVFFTNYVIDILLDYLKKDSSTSQISVNTIRKLLFKHEDNEKIQTVLMEKNIINTLIDWCLQENDKNRTCMEDASFIIRSMIGNQFSAKQTEIIDQQLMKIKDISKPNHLLLLYGLLCRLQRDVEVNYNILDDLTRLVLQTNDGFVQNIAVQLLANLINKCQNEAILNTYLNRIEQSRSDVTILSWITKALVMRNHEKANFWTNRLIELLKNDVNVATGFRIIVNDDYDSLSKKSHCIKTLLYQQKFFVFVSNKLSENYQPELDSYLVALGYLLERTPRQAILLQFNKILKLFILCLEKCEEVCVLLVLLDIIRDFLIKKEKCIEEHLKEFLGCLLKLSTFEKSMKVRILALKCLQEYTSSFPVYKLLPHKSEVLAVLGKVIDDKKRIVRREAVQARSLWFLFDAPM